jgi:amino acid adenylation domain-containing protein
MAPEANPAYNESLTITLRGKLDITVLDSALDLLTTRHESLRSCFTPDGMILLVAKELHQPLSLIDLSQEAAEQAQTKRQQIIDRATRDPFVLSQFPLCRYQLIRLQSDLHELVFTAHHLICDGSSLSLLVTELSTIYHNLRHDNAADRDLGPADSFVDYATEQWRTQTTNDQDLIFWQRQFTDLPDPLELPLRDQRPRQRSFRAKRFDFTFDESWLNDLKTFCRQEKISVVTFLMGCYALTLGRFTRSRDLVIGIPASGQTISGKQRLVGHCVHLLPIRWRWTSHQSAKDFLDYAKNLILDAYEHQQITFGELLKSLSLPRSADRIPLVSVLFNYDQKVTASQLRHDDITIDYTANPRIYENFELFLNLVDDGRWLKTELHYNTDLFTDDLMHALCHEMKSVARSFMIQCDEPLANLRRGAEPYYARLNATDQADASSSLVELISHWRDQHPEKIALQDQRETLSYEQLENQSTRLAHILRNRGLKPGQTVGVLLNRSVHLPMTLIAILKSGGIYVPLDPEFPTKRLRLMVNDADIKIVVTSDNISHSWLSSPTIVNLDRLPSPEQSVTSWPAPNADEAAYIIFTSGSTGRPKGVAIPHRAMLNFLRSMAAKPGFESHDRLLAVTTISFDISVLEIFLPLMQGGFVYVADNDTRTNPDAIGRIIKEQKISFLQATPAMWQLLVAKELSLGPGFTALTGGEPLPPSLAERLITSGATLWNMYGPTETTVWSTVARIDDPHAITIGHPIANTKVLIVDDTDKVLPPGVWGELLIGGAGVALGYIGRPDLTQERFIELDDNHPGTWYRTGDLGRLLPDGRLDIKGRLDNQVKIRGYRIELDEITACLEDHPRITEAVVIVKTLDRHDQRLVAYFHSPTELPVDALKSFLSESLPGYMLPQHYIPLPNLPRLPNGKLDRHNLPGPEESQPKTQTSALPSEDLPDTQLAKSLKRLWEKHLDSPLRSLSDDFFLNGGHSLLAAQLIASVNQECDRQLQMQDLFRFSKFGDLYHFLQATRSQTVDTIPKRDPDDRRPSVWQQRMWYVEQVDSNSRVHNLPAAWRIRGALDPEAFKQAFQLIIADHDALRMSFSAATGLPRQQLNDVRGDELDFIDCSIMDKTDETEILRRLIEGAIEKIDIESYPLFRSCLFKVDDQEWVFFFVAHHMIWDGWCFDLLLKKLDQYYQYTSGVMTEKPVQPATDYGDYCAWHLAQLKDSAEGEDWQYWLKQFQTIPESLDIPTDFIRPAEFQADAQTITFQFGQELTEALDRSARAWNMTPFMMIAAAYVLTLHRFSGQEDVVIGNPVRGRDRQELENIFGVFINVLPLRFQCQPAMTLKQYFTLIRRTCLNAYKHSGLPFDHLLSKLDLPRDVSRTPLFSAMFSYQDVANRTQQIGPLAIDQVHVPSGSVHTDLMLWIKKSANEVQGGLDFRSDLWETATAESMLDVFQQVLRALIQDEAIHLFEVPSLPPTQNQKLKQYARGDSLPVSSVESTLTRILRHSQTRPDHVAIKQGDEYLTYRELNERSHQFAQRLHAYRIKPGDLVAVCMERSINVIPALLGILRTGAAYIPLDPKLPKERLIGIIEEAQATALLIDQEYRFMFHEMARPIIIQDQPDSDGRHSNETFRDLPLDARRPAYVIYTSGSTGQPKGVAVSNRALDHFLTSIQQVIQFQQHDRLLAITTIAFDISILEMFLPLREGGCVYFSEQANATDPQHLVHLLERESISFMQATPASWQAFKMINWAGQSNLHILCGGETLSPELAHYLASRCRQLWNVYGPTEATVWATAMAVEPQQDTIFIGRPLPGYQAYVLDEQKKLTPLGAPGELYLAGPSLATGYLYRPELTAERFIHHSDLGRLYQTGDLARWRSEGHLEYLGRTDFQVKLRGFRIELGDIENHIENHPAVNQAVVILKEMNQDDQRLIAYVQLHDHETGVDLSLERLNQFLANILPQYMLPNHLIVVDYFPRSTSGKVDRKALPAPTLAPDRDTKRPPETPNQKRVAATFGKYLETDQIGLDDHFFLIGGHSLLAMKVLHELNQGAESCPVKLRHLLLERVEQIAALMDETQVSPDSEQDSSWLTKVFKWCHRS